MSVVGVVVLEDGVVVGCDWKVTLCGHGGER